jgi:photosystem II stability/assembly factor-like uncharacterized protein
MITTSHLRVLAVLVLALATPFAGRTSLPGEGIDLAAQSGPGQLSPFSSLSLRSIGPVNTSGRVDDIAVGRVAGQPDAIYVGSASGGVFKSTNGGTSWAPVFDEVDAMMSIGDIAVAPSNAAVVWVGTGEPNNRQSSSWGDGVYKSTDEGRTWTRMGLADTRHIGRIVVDPTNADVVYVAAQGHLWGPNAERGVFKTTDGGATWRKVLFVDENTGANDIVIDPRNPRVLLASTYQRQRRAWGFNGGGPGSGLYRSTDAGEHWTRLSNGLPAGDLGRIGLDLFPSDGRVVYATVEAGNGASGLYRTVNAGAMWERLATLNTRPSYYSQVRLDPKDRNRVYMLGSNRGFYLSHDAGRTFADIFAGVPGASKIHGEDHALWVDPDDPNHLIIGGDGGVSVSRDRGLSWDFRANMPIGQFYEIDADNSVPFTVCGGLQDNGMWCTPSAVRDRNGIAAVDAWNVGGGDGFNAEFDPTDSTYAYIDSQNGGLARVNIVTRERQSIRPTGPGLRWNWDAPILVSSVDPRVIYVGANMLFRSTDRGTTWTAVSPDLTASLDPNTLSMMGKPIPADARSRNDGVSGFGSITTIAESPFDARVLYTGADDGTVQQTADGGKTWTNITSRFPGLPPNTYVSTMLASRHSADRVYATFDGHYNDDYRPYVYVSDDAGRTWRSLAAGLPETSINRLREHPSNPRVLVLAHERGVHVSNDDGKTWMPLSRVTNFPNVPTDDVVIQPRDNALVLGTHGRSIWILDDMGPIEALTPEALASDAVLAPIAPAREMITFTPQAWYGAGTFFAPNPDFDAGINYYLRAAATGPVEVEITDIFGGSVRTLQGPSARGLNHVGWDLRAEPPAPVAGAETTAGRGGRGGGGRGGGGRGGRGSATGPLVAPGTYHVTIRVPGVSHDLHGDVRVEADPIAGVKR